MGGTIADTSEQSSDALLVDRVRMGDGEAYGLLYERHVSIARRFASSLLLNTSDVDDVVSDVFASVLSALQRGNGPTGCFLPYLLGSVRNECYRANRRTRREPADRFGVIETAVDEERAGEEQEPSRSVAEATVVRVAFESLSDDFRVVLWRSEVQDEASGDIAATRGTTSNTVGTTLLRARRALASAYLQQHVGTEPCREADAACRIARPLSAYVRGEAQGRTLTVLPEEVVVVGVEGRRGEQLLVHVELAGRASVVWEVWVGGHGEERPQVTLVDLAVLRSPDPAGVAQAAMALPQPRLRHRSWIEQDPRTAAPRLVMTDRGLQQPVRCA